MKFTNKKILLISPEPWNHIHVSKHHYARYLAGRGNEVVFLNPPGSKWALADIKNPKVLDYTGFWKGQRFLPTWMRKWHQLRVFKKIEEFTEIHFDVVWSFDNSVFFQMDAFPAEIKTVSHIVDHNMDYQMAVAAGTANVCFCTTRFIKEKLELYNDRVFLINHGFNLSEDSSEYLSQRSCVDDRCSVGYAGNLDIIYLDWSLIKNACSSFPKVNFYFAGPMKSKEVKAYFDQISNLHYVGVLSSDLIQSFYQEMDALILTYQADSFREQLANPHKLLEYLYSGKPVVATFTEEYQDNDLIFMSKENEEWITLFGRVLQNLEKFSSKELVDKRKKYALDNTYDKQIDRIEKILASLPS